MTRAPSLFTSTVSAVGLFFGLGACGPETETESGRLGVCFVMTSETDGRPDADTVVWRPCTRVEEKGEMKCAVRILDREETHDLDSPDVMTCGECYSQDNSQGYCDLGE